MKKSACWTIALLLGLYLLVPLVLGRQLYLMSLIVSALILGGIALAWALLGNLGGMVVSAMPPSSASAPMCRPC